MKKREKKYQSNYKHMIKTRRLINFLRYRESQGDVITVAPSPEPIQTTYKNKFIMISYKSNKYIKNDQS